MFRIAPIFGIGIMALGAASIGFAADNGDGKAADSKIWGGVFSAAQVERGKDEYAKHCSNCHSPNLSGTVRAPTLRGDKFMQDWQNGSMNVLFVKIRDSMPADYPETVSEQIKLDVMTYLLEQNGFPVGSTELKVDEKELEDIQIAPKGNQAATNFAVVRMVGCLAQGPDKTWTLNKSTEPATAKEEIASPASLKTAAESPLGTQTYELLSTAAFKPESRSGQRVEARGLLYREGSHKLLNLTSLENTGSPCN